MEKQRSFWKKKPTKFLVFSLTIPTSLILVSFFLIWVIKASPSFQRQQFHVSATDELTTRNANFFFRRTAGKPDPAGLGGSDPSTLSPPDHIHTRLPNSSLDQKFSAALASSDNIIISRKPSNFTTSGIPVSRWPANFTSGIPLDLSTSSSSSSSSKDDKPNQDLSTKLLLYNNSNNGDVPADATSSDKVKRVVMRRRNPMQKGSSTISGPSECDVTKGKWVFDESYPLYRNTSCPFIDEGFNCEANGRLDQDYMKWRWLPQDCDFPRFNASQMLELIRGKRLVFVGDSLNRNQWESMLCLLMGAIKDPKKVYETRGRRITKSRGDYSFKFVDYKCTVEFYATHFLVHESKARMGKKRLQTLRIDTIDKGSSRWRGAHILVFNTAHWWTHYKTKAGINYYQEGDQIHPRLQVSVAFRRALETWASWVDKHVNPRQTRVFFRSSAPSHFSGGQWNTGGHCKEASHPTNATFATSPVTNGLVEEVIKQMKTPVTFLNITGLSNYRVDAHPSVYGRKSENNNFLGVQDCSHWCLPGVPDSWNELLYYHLLFNGRNKPH